MKAIRVTKRRGKFLALTVLLSMVLLGFGALAVDVGVLSTVRAQLKTVADAGALAGARQLVSDKRLDPSYTPTTEVASARSAAITLGQANVVLGQSAMVLSGDVAVGYKRTTPADPIDSTFTATTSANTNSVQLTATRDGSHGGAVPAYFSRIWSSAGTTASVTSTATVEIFSIGGFTPGSTNTDLLPIAYSQSLWQDMFNTPITDNYSYSPGGGTYGTVTSGHDGVPETSVFPVDNAGPGNWGTFNIGVGNNSTNTLGDQIRYGVTPAQMAAAGDITAPTSFSGNPGISAGIKDDLAAIIGKPLAIALYDSSSGSGNNLTYHIVQYVAARIVAVDLTGNPMFVVVQPAYVTDPTANPGPTNSTWQQGGLVRLHLSR
jgi:Flp pilus assembly protein TadG